MLTYVVVLESINFTDANGSTKIQQVPHNPNFIVIESNN